MRIFLNSSWAGPLMGGTNGICILQDYWAAQGPIGWKYCNGLTSFCRQAHSYGPKNAEGSPFE
jgi:hypothetical protein